jgi:hypothetical protein
MFMTPKGDAAALKMRDSKVAILLKISDKAMIGHSQDSKKAGPLYAETDGVKDANDEYESATITVYKGTFDAEKAGTLKGEKGEYVDYSESEFYNSVMVHEKTHIDEEGTTSKKRDDCKKCSEEKMYDIGEKIPNEKEKENHLDWHSKKF